MNIVVLCGGISSEREVSLLTGELVYKSLKEQGYKVCYLDLSTDIDFDINNINPFEIEYDINTIKDNHLLNKNKRIGQGVLEIMKLADLVFVCLHGEDGEDGKIQALMDLYNIKYTGSNQVGCLLSMYKDIAKEIMIKNKIKTPKYFKYNKQQETNLKYPFVVKPINGGSSLGVTIVKNNHDYTAIKEHLNENYIIEEYIKGREFSVGIIDGKSLPVIEIIPNDGFYDYENKYTPGKTQEIVPAKLSRQETKMIQDLALKVHEILKLGFYSRIDFIRKKKNSFYCLEANALPGLTNISLLPQEAKAVGIDFNRLCHMIVKSALK